MDEQDLDKLFECFKKSESNRCGARTSKDRLYYNKTNTGNCGCQNGIEQKPTQSSAINSQPSKSTPKPINNIAPAPKTSKPISEPYVISQCGETVSPDSVSVEKIKEPSSETLNPVSEPRIICKCGEKISLLTVPVQELKESSPKTSKPQLKPRIICKCGENSSETTKPELENPISKPTIECKCGENNIASVSASVQKIKVTRPELIKPSTECKCGGPNNSPVAPVSVTTKKRDSLEIINNTHCSTCQNIDFQQSLKSLQNQIDATYRNIESVRDLNKNLKSGVGYLQNSLNNIKEGRNSLESFNINYNVEVKCACKQPDEQTDETLNKLKKPSIIKCGKIPLNSMSQLAIPIGPSVAKVMEKYSNSSDTKCFPCRENETPIELKQPSSKHSGNQMMQPACGVRKLPSDECHPCKEIDTPTSLKKISFVTCSGTPDGEVTPLPQLVSGTTETSTSIINNLRKCAEQCRQYLDAISAARAANTKALQIQNDVHTECKITQHIEEDLNTSCGETKISNDVTESTHKCQQFTNKANNASQVDDFKTTKSKFNAKVQCDWEVKDQSTQCNEDVNNVNMNEAATGSDLKQCTNKGIQCSNKKNNATQSKVFVNLKNNVEVQSAWDTKIQATQYDQISNAETEICNDLLKCTKCTITTQNLVETDVCIRESPKFASSRKDDATQSIITPVVSSATNKCVQCSHVKQNSTQADKQEEFNKPTKNETTLTVNDSKEVNKCEQCSTATETPKTIQDNDKKQCGWKKTNQTTKATEEVHQNLYNAPLLNMQNSVKAQTESREALRIENKDTCLACAKKVENLTQTDTVDKNQRFENLEIQQSFVALEKRTNTCPHCLHKMNNESSKPLGTAKSHSFLQTESETTQSCHVDNAKHMLKNDLTVCTRDQQFSNKIKNVIQSEEKNDNRYDNIKDTAVQCHQKIQNASTQSTDKDTKSNEVDTGTSSNVTVCADQCQQSSTKSDNITQTERFKNSSFKTQCALEAEDKITQAAVNVCLHCLNKLKDKDKNDIHGFTFQNGKKTQSIDNLCQDDSEKLSNQNHSKRRTTSSDDINKIKCRQCTNLAEYSAQTESVKSLNIRKSVKSQTETRAFSDGLSRTHIVNSVDKGIQSSNKRDRGSQTDQMSVPRLSVKIQTGNSTRKKSNAKRSSFTSQTSLKRLSSSSRMRPQKQMQSTSGILKNSQTLRKNNCAGSQTNPVSNYYLSSLNSNNKCGMNRNYCSSSSNYMCNSNCSRHRHNSSCYLP